MSIPILIGGSGERKTLPLVGRYADIWHSYEPLDEFRRKNDILKRLALFTAEIKPTETGYALAVVVGALVPRRQ